MVSAGYEGVSMMGRLASNVGLMDTTGCNLLRMVPNKCDLSPVGDRGKPQE